jgi:GT2 family glycosyltransferase
MTGWEGSALIALLCNWWNHPELLDDFCDAVAGECWDDLLVMDNASEPETARLLAQRIPALGGRVIHRTTNSQLAATAESVEKTTADTLVFVNSDVRRVRAGWLSRLAEGVRPGVVCGHAWRTELGIRYLEGWCLGMTRADWSRLGGYDAAYEEPPYWADVDLSWRAERLGITLECVDAGLFHHTSASIAAFRHEASFWAIFDRNRDRFVSKLRLVESG